MKRSARLLLSTSSALVALAGVLLAVAGPAGADPVNPTNHSLVVTLRCDQLGTLDVIGEGNGRWDRAAEPMHALESNLVLVAYSFHFELTPPGSDTPVVLVDYSKPAPQNGRLDVCRLTDVSPELGTFNGTFGVSYSGAS